MNFTDCCCQMTQTNLWYKILTDEVFYELVFEDDLTEGQIINNVIHLPHVSSVGGIITNLKYLYACIAFGNCVRVRAELPAIVATLEDLQKRCFGNEIYSIVLQLVEHILLTEELTTSWPPLTGKILRLLLCSFHFDNKPTAQLTFTLKNIAAVLPIEKTIDTIRSYLLTEYEDIKDYDRLLWSLKLLSELAIQRGVEVTPRHVRKVKDTLVTLTRDKCNLVSTMSVQALVDLYVNTHICPSKCRIQLELEKLLPESMYIVKDYYDKIHFFFCEPEISAVESSEHRILNEYEIIERVCNLTPETPIEERKQAFAAFNECLAYENCEQAIKNFRKIFQTLMILLKLAATSVDFSIVLDVLEGIFRCKPMKPYWTAYNKEILLRIILSYDQDKETTEAIELFFRNIADTLPVTETIKIIDSLIATAEYPFNLCAMKLLWEVAGQHKLFSRANLDNILTTVIRTIDDPEKNIRLVAECVIYKLSNKLGEQRITKAIANNPIINRRLRNILRRTNRRLSIWSID